jgi:hypothetical protein
MFVFNIVSVIFWLAISLKWAQWAYEPVMHEPYLGGVVMFFAYGIAYFHAIALLIRRVSWFQLILFVIIFNIMWAMGYA